MMSVAEQRFWRLLGQSRDTWVDNSITNIYSASFLRWDELSSEQLEAARSVGHSAATWAGCAGGWSTPKQIDLTPPEFTDPKRTVRAVMTILRPFSEVSGNVFGQVVAAMPTSFIQMFEIAIARVLYCDNPSMATDQRFYVASDGEPKCYNQERFDSQMRRVKVVSVIQGSIIVDFIICGESGGAPRGICSNYNHVLGEEAAADSYDYLQRQLSEKNSSLSFDPKFGRFARAASLAEIKLRTIEDQELDKVLMFERLRSHYKDPKYACELLTDKRNNISLCVSAGQQVSFPRAVCMVLLGAAALFTI